MKVEIQNYVNNCMCCMEIKPDLNKIKKDYHITAELLRQLISGDILGKLPSSSTSEYILSLVEIATKFVMLNHLRKATSREVLNRFSDNCKH